MAEYTRTTVLETIGNTPLVRLRHVIPKISVRILLKMESQNPTGCMKDRMALSMITAAENDGRLPQGGTVVEYTGGSTGVSLALVCAAEQHPLHLVSSDAFSKEKLDHVRLLGADLTINPSDNGKQTEALTRSMIRQAHVIAYQTGAYITAQREIKAPNCKRRDLGRRDMGADRRHCRRTCPECRKCSSNSRKLRDAAQTQSPRTHCCG